jgi:Transcriptional regulators
MDVFCHNLNALLMRAFRSVLKIEEQMLSGMGQYQLSINEMHMLEAIANEANQGRTISELAKALSLKMPSITVAVNKLEKKGLLKKERAAEDGRSVLVTLTELGAKLERIHQRFHESMVKNISRDMDEAEKTALLRGMEKLNLYFDKKLPHE